MKTTQFLLIFCLFGALYLFGWRENLNSCRPKGRILQSNGDISFPSSSFIIEDYLDIYFDIDTTDITMLIKCITPGRYFSIGFGSPRMAGSDMWVFTLNSGEIRADDHYGTGWGFPPRDSANGGANDLEVLGYEITSSYSLVKVKRALNTGDSRDYVIREGIPIDIIYATGPSHSMVNHGPTRGHVQVALINGMEGVVLEDIKTFGPVDLHGIFNVIAWGLLIDIAIIVARYLRGSKFTLWRITITAHLIHSALMWLAFILSTIVTITLLKRKGADGLSLNGEAKHDFHVINGIVILGLSSLAVAIGGLNYYLMRIYKNTVSAKTILYLRRGHLGLGLLLYLLAKVNIIIGVVIYDQGSWKVPVLVYLGVLLLFHILFQSKMLGLFSFIFKKKTNSSLLPKSSQNPKHINLLKAINNGTPIEDIRSEFPHIKWVQLGNSVYDLSNWVHPGGNFIIEACIGREVGRYLYGNYALENSNVKPYKHSNLALSQIKKFYIGEATSSESILVHKSTKEEGQATNDHLWKISSVKTVSRTVSEISFTSEHFSVKTFGSSLSSLGRHFKVSFNSKDAIARQYTTAQALTDINTRFRQNAYEYFVNIMTPNQDQTSDSKMKIDDSFQTVTDSLPLFIKNYPFPGALSRALHEVDIKGDCNELIVEGPIGRGLDLTAGSTGTHTIICAGTGVLPFIDFLNFFLFKIMYQAIKAKAGMEKAEEINVYKAQFDNVMEGLKVNFIGSFDNEKEVPGLDILQKLAEISKRYKTDNFSAMIKGYGDENIVEVKEFFSKGFFEKNVDLKGDKYYVVGPPKMNAMVSKDLASLGVAKEKVILV